MARGYPSGLKLANTKEVSMVLATVAMLVVFNTVDISQIHTPSAISTPVTMKTSWYGEETRGRMANGEVFRSSDPTTAAHKKLPFGTKLQLTNPENGRCLTVEVKDRGPFVGGRDLDISEAAAKKLGMKECGVKALLAKIVK